MSVWKSPVFYFGIFLVAALVMLLVAPFVVDWDQWRGKLESYGHKITGRSVAINGPINVRLFPFPTLQMNDVAIANPPGFHGAAMAEVKRITAHLGLGGLFSGEIRVEGIDVESPVVNLARNEQGEVNWRFIPDEQLAQSHLLDKVRLDGIVVTAGRIHLADEPRAQEVVLDHLDGRLSAPTFTGPWRANLTGDWNDVPLEISVTTAEWPGEGPIKFGFKFAPQDGVTPTLVFDGAQDDGHLKGKIGLQPSPREDGRQGLEGQFKPLQAQADIDASFDMIDLASIRVTPADEKDTGTLIEGKAHFDLADGMKANVALTSPHVDLDTLAGTQSLRVWRAGGVMALVNSALAVFPEKLNVTAKLDVAALSAAGETLENVHLEGSADPNDIRIKDFTADLPGRSRMKFNGIVFPGPGAAELGGTLAFESSDTRSFSQWLWPEGSQTLAKLWTGARGRLKAQSDVTWNGKQFGLQNLNYEFDGEPGKAELAVAVGVLPAVRLKLDAGAVDVESYLKGGLLSLAQGGLGGLLQNADGIEKRLQLSAKSLTLNGIMAQNVAFDFDSSASGFEIKKLDVGAVGGARLSGEGLVLNGPDGPSGNIKLKLAAERLSAVLQLLGALPKGPEPRWMATLGASQFDADFAVKPGATEPAVSYALKGTSGDFSIGASGTVKDLAKWPQSQLGVSSTLSAADDAAFARLVDLTQSPTGRSGHMTLTATGTLADGFATAAAAEMFGSNFSLDGKISSASGTLSLDGKISAKADDVTGISRLLGLPVLPPANTPMVLDAVAKAGHDGENSATISLKLGDSEIRGNAGIDSAGVVSADLNGGHLRLAEFLGVGFLPWRGDYTSLDQSFSDGFILGRVGHIHYVPDLLSPGLGPDLAKPAIDFSFAKDARQFKLAGADQGSNLLEFSLKTDGSNFTLDGKLASGFNLDEILRKPDGTVLGKGNAAITANFTSSARSPAGLLAGMTGTGRLKLLPLSLPLFSPEPFFTSLADVKDASGLQNTFKLVNSAPGTELDGGQVDIAIKQGSADLQTLSLNQGTLVVALSASHDLANNDLRVDLVASKSDQPDLPGFKVSYQGPVGALSEKDDFKALSDKLGYGFIARDMAELDR
ncbi:MAG: AsmA family protein, partial [Aestuariivirga sp.]